MAGARTVGRVVTATDDSAASSRSSPQLLAARPWSFPASLVPVVLTAAALARIGIEWSWVHLALAVFGGMAVHAGANLTNTYYDFQLGVDTKDRADDRTLVDGLLRPSDVFRLAMGCFAVGVSVVGFAFYLRGALMLGIAAAGLVLAFFYTASPFSLKFMGLGELVIFLCFGPLLMLGASVLLVGPLTPWVDISFLSLPIGLVTVAILHANNTRDIEADLAAGAFTLPQRVSFRSNLRAYRALLWLTVGAGVASLVAIDARAQLLAAGHAACPTLIEGWLRGTVLPTLPPSAYLGSGGIVAAAQCRQWTWSTSEITAGLLALAATLPWCLGLQRRFERKELSTLPQQTAQFSLLFGACLLCGLVPFPVLARGALGILFYLGGVNNIIMWKHTSALVHSKVTLVVPGLPQWATDSIAALATLGQTVAAALFILGVFAREAAIAMALFLVAVSPLVHNFWNAGLYASQERVSVPDDPVAYAKAWKEKGAGAETARPAETPARDEATGTANGSGGLRRRRGSDATAAPGGSTELNGGAASTASTTAEEIEDARPVPGNQGGVPTFLAAFDNEFVHFFKNVGMLGGLLVYISLTPPTQ